MEGNAEAQRLVRQSRTELIAGLLEVEAGCS